MVERLLIYCISGSHLCSPNVIFVKRMCIKGKQHPEEERKEGERSGIQLAFNKCWLLLLTSLKVNGQLLTDTTSSKLLISSILRQAFFQDVNGNQWHVRVKF